jgi:hypothetical protein
LEKPLSSFDFHFQFLQVKLKVPERSFANKTYQRSFFPKANYNLGNFKGSFCHYDFMCQFKIQTLEKGFFKEKFAFSSSHSFSDNIYISLHSLLSAAKSNPVLA